MTSLEHIERAPDIFKARPLNVAGFPTSVFSKYLAITQRTLIDAGLPRKIKTLALNLRTEFNSSLRQRDSRNLSTHCNTFIKILDDLCRVLSLLVPKNMLRSREPHQKVKRRLMLEVKQRALVPRHHIENILSNPMKSWDELRKLIMAAISSLQYLLYLPETF